MGNRLFVSFFANIGGQTQMRHVTCDAGPVSDDNVLAEFVSRLEESCGYEKGAVTILSFQPLEDAA